MDEPRPRPRPPRPGRGPAGAVPPVRGPVMVDATLGLGGHTEAVLTRCELARVIGIDRDPAALDAGRASGWPASATASPACTRSTTSCPTSSTSWASTRVDAVLFDLGVSSMQLDVRERGFAYAEDAPLDMRMDGTTGPTAADVLNTYSAEELTRVLREYGEERFASKIAARRGPAARAGAVHDLGPPGRAAYAEIPAPGAAYRRPPRQAHLPGAAHGGQRRARRAAPGGPGRDRRHPGRRPRGRRVLPLARGPAGQAGVHRGHPLPRPARPAGGAGGAPSRPSASSPAAPSRPTPTRSPPTPAPPRSGCARSNAPRTEQRHEHSSPPAPRAAPAARRGRRRPGPAHRRAPAPGPRRPDAVRHPGQPGAARRCRRAALLQHPDAAGVVRRHLAGDPVRQPRRPRADPPRRARRSCATRRTSPPQAPGGRHGRAADACTLRLAAGTTDSGCTPATGPTPRRCWPRGRRSRRCSTPTRSSSPCAPPGPAAPGPARPPRWQGQQGQHDTARR